ncbi:MAG TPA: hypothetical protein VLI06_05865 [Solimonas sp.]|nr:hypothetical protein [Solimonas sp.]
MNKTQWAAGLIFAALLLSACRSVPLATSAAIPEGCSRATALPAAPLRYSAARAEAGGLAGAGTIRVERTLAQLSDWHELGGGWSLLNVAIEVRDANSLSLHLAGLKLPPRTELWFCSADRRSRQGPYRDAAGGELWTPVVPGGNALLEVVVPDAGRHDLAGQLRELYVGR